MKQLADPNRRVARLVAVMMMLAMSAHAEIKNFVFHGVIKDVEDDSFTFEGSITNGCPFDGFYVFDSAAVDSNTNTTSGEYTFTNRAFGIVVKVGKYTFRTDAKNPYILIGAVNSTNGDSYVVISYNNVCS
jgi:hypothetical protein